MPQAEAPKPSDMNSVTCHTLSAAQADDIKKALLKAVSCTAATSALSGPVALAEGLIEAIRRVAA